LSAYSATSDVADAGPAVPRSQAILALAAFSGAALVLWVTGIGSTANQWFVIVLAPALVLRRTRAFLRDFVPFLVLVLVYEWARTEAHRLHPSAFYAPQIDADRFLGFGNVPTVWLQQHLWHGDLDRLDRFLIFIHGLNLAGPIIVLFLVWLGSRRDYLRSAGAFLGAAFASCVGFLLFPAAPPWLAAQQGLLDVTRIRELADPATTSGLARELFDDNPVAAIPSLHAGWSLIVVLVAWRYLPRPAAWVALFYAALMHFAVVYLGEHYVIDLVLGDAVAVGAWVASGRVAAAREAGQPVRAPVLTAPQPEASPSRT
jgi:hypothetical protein